MSDVGLVDVLRDRPDQRADAGGDGHRHRAPGDDANAWPGRHGAPPSRAPMSPSSANAIRSRPRSRPRAPPRRDAAATSGSAAPAENDSADVHAACSGRAMRPSSRPSSSLALGPAHPQGRALVCARPPHSRSRAGRGRQGDHHSGAAGARRLVRTGARGACARISRTGAARRLHRRGGSPPHGRGRQRTTGFPTRCWISSASRNRECRP